MKKKFVLAAVAVAIIAIAALITIRSRRGAATGGEIRLNGRIEAETVDLAPKVAGRVAEVLVSEGQRVKAGQLLVRLDLGETDIAVEREAAGVRAADARVADLEAGTRAQEISAAEAEVADRRAAANLAAKELERQRFLLGRKVGTQRDVDRAVADVERTSAAVRASEQRLGLARQGFREWQTAQARIEAERARVVLRQAQTVAKEGEIRAPADAVVVHRLAEPGALLTPAQPAVTLAFADRLYVRTFIPEPSLGQVRHGSAARVEVDAFPGRTFEGRVAQISPSAEFTPKAVETKEERVNLVYGAKVDLTRGWSEPLVPGQPAVVIVPRGAEAGEAK